MMLLSHLPDPWQLVENLRAENVWQQHHHEQVDGYSDGPLFSLPSGEAVIPTDLTHLAEESETPEVHRS
jgi:hypothetical protein